MYPSASQPVQQLQKIYHSIASSLLHLAFPHCCAGCGTDVLEADHQLCIHCFSELPETKFTAFAHNPIEKLFWGRMHVQAATAQYYFTKESMMQHLMHQLKYKGNKELGVQLGQTLGHALKSCERFKHVDALVPLPLHASRERRRGYNQALIICNGIAEVWGKPVFKNVLTRPSATETQTKKGRIERWQNIAGRFKVANTTSIEGKHVLLVDDVITTGATMEAAGRALLAIPSVQLSIAALCFSST